MCPPDRQIALKNGSPQDWGLVEFMSADVAEKTWQQMQGHQLRGSRLQVHFCMPGVRAIKRRVVNQPFSDVAPAPTAYATRPTAQCRNSACRPSHTILTGQPRFHTPLL